MQFRLRTNGNYTYFKSNLWFCGSGGEFASCCSVDEKGEDSSDDSSKPEIKFPFAGGSGAGVSINPVAFMVVGQDRLNCCCKYQFLFGEDTGFDSGDY